MEEQIKQILPFLEPNQKLEVQTQALQIIQSLSADPSNIDPIYNTNVIREVAKL